MWFSRRKSKSPVVIIKETPSDKAVITKRPQVIFALEAWQRFWANVLQAAKEVSGVGCIVRSEKALYIPEIFDCTVIPQKGGAIETILDGMGPFFNTFISQGGNPAELKLWWHSHVGNPVFWSSHEDEPTIEEFGEKSKWWLSVVGNRQRQILCRLDVFEPVRLTLDWLPVFIAIPFNQPLFRECLEGIQKNVSPLSKRDEDLLSSIDATLGLSMIIPAEQALMILPEEKVREAQDG